MQEENDVHPVGVSCEANFPLLFPTIRIVSYSERYG